MNSSFDMASLVKSLNIKKSEIPFVGLRPFEADESHLFFGRDKQIADLLQKLHTHQFLAIVGSSGCGKSSLIRAGLIPKLKAGFLTEKRDHWIIATLRPSGDPLLYFSNAVNEAFETSAGDLVLQKPGFTPEELTKIGVSGVIKTMHELMDNQRVNLLILVDQFEELFTYKTGGEKLKNDNVFFVSLLLALANEKNLPVYTIITMRSDYIGSCNRFFGLPEILNESQYLVPRLKWQQIREVIESPIKLFGQKISPGLLDLLTNDSDKELDQLPVLQHCLMRTYGNWINDGKQGSIEFKHYENSGCLNGALNKHADEVYGELNENQKKIAQYLFQAITDYKFQAIIENDKEDEPIRRPRSYFIIKEICKAVEAGNENDVAEVINRFRRRSCAFLTPPESVKKIIDQSIIDISHESLMRQWGTLKGWMKNEQRSADKLFWLSECVTEQRELLRGLDITTSLSWKKKQNPNNEWASRYINNLDAVEEYIEKSRVRDKRRRWINYGSIFFAVAGVITTIAIISSTLVSSAEAKQKAAEANQREANTQKKAISLKAQGDSARAAEQLEKTRTDSILLQVQIARDKANEQILYEKQQSQLQAELLEKTQNIKNESMSDVLDLTKEYFYQSQSLDTAFKRKYVLELIYLKYAAGNSRGYNSFLTALNKVALGLESAKEDPNKSLWIVGHAAQLYHHPVLDSLFGNLMDQNLFYSSKTVFPDNGEDLLTDSRIHAISKNKDLFAYLQGDSIRLGRIDAKKITLLPALPIPRTYVKYSRVSRSNTNIYGLRKLVFKDDNTLLGLMNDSIIYHWNLDGALLDTKNINNTNSYQIKTFTPDGSKLLLGSLLNNSVIIRNNIGDTLASIVIPQARLGTLSNVEAAPDSKRYLIVCDQGIFSGNIYSNKDTSSSLDFTEANFFNSDSIIAYTTKGEKINLLDTKLTPKFKDIIIADKLDPGETIESIQLSADRKKMLVQVVDAQSKKHFLVIKNLNDSELFELETKKEKKGNRFVVRKVYNASSIGFLQNDQVSAYQQLNKWLSMSIWKKFNRIDVSDICSESMPPLQISEKIKYGITDVNSIKDEKILNLIAEETLASYRNSGDRLGLLSNYTTNKVLTQSFGTKYWHELNRATEDVFEFDQDTMNYCNNLSLLVRLGEAGLLSKNEESKVDSVDLSVSYGMLAFLSMFNAKINYDSVIRYASRGLRLDSVQNNWIYSNLALGYLFSGKYKEAYKIYTKFIDSTCNCGVSGFREGFMDDLKRLEGAGIINPTKIDLYERVKKIRKFLNSEISTLD